MMAKAADEQAEGRFASFIKAIRDAGRGWCDWFDW